MNSLIHEVHRVSPLRKLLKTPNVRILAFAMLIAAFGSGMFLAGSAIFFTKSVGLSPVSFGTGLSIASVVGLCATLPLGTLADWMGPKRLLIILHFVRATAFISLAFVGDAATFTILASIQAASQQGSTPILQALISQTTDDANRTSVMAMIRSIRNVGFSLGALAAAPLIATTDLWANRGVMIGTGAAIGVAGALLLYMRQTRNGIEVRSASPFAGLRSVGDVRYLGLAGFNGILSLHMTMLTVGFPLWVASREDIGNWMASLVLTVNTVMVVGAQIWFARSATSNSGARRVLWLGAGSLAASCIAMAVAGMLSTTTAIIMLFVAVVIFTAGEMWQSAGSWELSFRLAPEKMRSSYLSVYALGIAAQDAVGPLLFVMLILPNGGLGWIGLAGLFFLGALGATSQARIMDRGTAEGLVDS